MARESTKRAMRKYSKTIKFKASQRKYLLSDKGRIKRKEARQRHEHTTKYHKFRAMYDKSLSRWLSNWWVVVGRHQQKLKGAKMCPKT